MPLYYIETDLGCGIREASNIKQAKGQLLREVGTYNIGKGICRKATKNEIEWVRGMGGRVPQTTKT